MKESREELTGLETTLNSKILDIKKENNKVSFLIEYLQDLKAIHSYEIYQVLKKILSIRRESIPAYRIADLKKEKGMCLDVRQIYYYMNYQYMTKKTLERIESGEITHSTFLFLINRSKEIRISTSQNKLVTDLVSKKITLEEISKNKSRGILKKIGVNPTIAQNDLFIGNICSKINNIRLLIVDNQKEIKESQRISEINEEIVNLRNVLNKLNS